MSSAKKPPAGDNPLERRRVPFEREVSLKFQEFRGFLTEVSGNLSSGGMFIRTESPKPPGSAFDFEILLEDGFTLLQGIGEVVWTRPRRDSQGRPAGMGVRFLGLTQQSHALIRRIVQEHVASGGAPFDPDQVPEPEPPESPPVSPPAIPPDPPESLEGPQGLSTAGPPEQRAREREPAPSLVSPSAASASASAPAVARSAVEKPAVPAPAPPRSKRPPHRPPERAPRPAPRRSAWRRWVRLSAASAGLFLTAAAGMYGYLLWSLGATPPPVGAPSLLTTGTAETSAASAPPTAPPPARAAGGNGDRTPVDGPREGTPEGAVNRAENLAARRSATPAVSAGGAANRASETRPPQTAPAAGQPSALSQVTEITWQPEPGGLAVILQGDGPFEAKRYNRLRLEASPRELVRVLGITRAFPRTQVPVGTPEVWQIRIGYHRRPGDNQLHVVLDLASPQVTLESLEPDGDRLILHLARP